MRRADRLVQLQPGDGNTLRLTLAPLPAAEHGALALEQAANLLDELAETLRGIARQTPRSFHSLSKASRSAPLR